MTQQHRLAAAQSKAAIAQFIGDKICGDRQSGNISLP